VVLFCGPATGAERFCAVGHATSFTGQELRVVSEKNDRKERDTVGALDFTNSRVSGNGADGPRAALHC
jgi:hypothetical protein